ncbi:metal-dependent hydrolase [Cryptosporangium phraense]|uniref:Metal-dependent hydrolase n=1 Tax=Cryptosporangium phraense TaxID=2593070 RepID=A0A545AZ30_9ACTN|nr:metal-dependent hydrolase [Cryptosporangium phraense]TQS46592.1 metal-dependent hydrolase [Cryptosporangium phraense]
MVMGPTHAISGAAAWLVGSAVAAQLGGYMQSPIELTTYTVACAGAALLPDLDTSGRVTANKGGATVARTFGIVSLFLAECVEKVSLGVYTVTRSRRDAKRRNGHRTFTHTWLFAAGLGFGVGYLAERYGRTAVVIALFLLFGLGIRGLMADAAKSSGWIIVTALSALAAYVAIDTLPADRGYPLLGLSVGIGCVVHTFGDMITKAGCPVLWPLPIRGRRWHEVGMPDRIAVRAGGTVERTVLVPAFTVLAVLGVIIAVPGVAALLSRALSRLSST